MCILDTRSFGTGRRKFKTSADVCASVGQRCHMDGHRLILSHTVHWTTSNDDLLARITHNAQFCWGSQGSGCGAGTCKD